MPLLTLLGQKSTTRTIGGTSQLGGFSSSGGLNVFTVHTVGDSSQLDAFSSTGAIKVPSTVQGGHYLPPKYVKTKLKKKDNSIKESIEALLTEVKQAPVIIPLKTENKVRELYDRTPEVVNLKASAKKTQQLAALTVEIQAVRKSIKRLVKEEMEDEDEAIRVLMELM